MHVLYPLYFICLLLSPTSLNECKLYIFKGNDRQKGPESLHYWYNSQIVILSVYSNSLGKLALVILLHYRSSNTCGNKHSQKSSKSKLINIFLIFEILKFRVVSGTHGCKRLDHVPLFL